MFFGAVYSQQVPGKEQSQSILISNGTIHVGNCLLYTSDAADD